MVAFYNEKIEHEAQTLDIEKGKCAKCDKEGFVEVYVWSSETECSRNQFCREHWDKEKLRIAAVGHRWGYRKL